MEFINVFGEKTLKYANDKANWFNNFKGAGTVFGNHHAD